jgi:hypothetical protein
VLCDFTETDIIKANRELQKADCQKESVQMQYEEIDQQTQTLKNKNGILEMRMDQMRLP